MRCSIFLTLCFTLLFHFSFQVFAQDQSSPFAPTSTDFSVWGPRLPNDKIMPEKEKIEQIKSWVAAAFAKKKAEPINVPFTIKLIRQDHNTLKFNQSCMGTPFQIGTKSFENGLGTHANSEILIEFAEPITRFTAQVGIDNNYDTQGTKGSVQFIVQVQNKELLRTPILTGKDEPYKIDLKLPDGTKNLTLLVSTTDDGPNHDQSNWCEPVAYGVSGQSYLITKTELPFQTELPFSFQYGGVASSELLPKWTFEEKILNPLETAYRWTDPKTKFRVTATVRLFERFCAADWVLHFENGSNQDSLLLENVRTFDMTFPVGIGNEPVCIHTLNGDTYSEFTWLPAKYPLKPGETKTFAPAGGRPSNYAFPFWNVQNRNAGDETVSKGFFIAIGWSGQWKTDFKRIDETNLAVAGGMETLSAILHPNESIRTPRVLIMPWETDRLTSQVLFRRLLMFEYAPKMQNGLPQQLLFVGQCFDRYYRKRTGWETIDSQKQFAQKLAEAGCNAYWFDAAWFPVGFPNGVGNWFSDPVNFPNGVEELGKTVHDLGLKFVLWFEPERVAAGTQIAKEYSRYVFGGENGGLYKLNDPEAQKFLSDLLIKRIKEFGVDVYRNDFNIDPLHFWKQNEENNRHGITEIRYVEGHYEMWNRFRSEFPGLWIDNCASGGRRIDLETTTISIPLWRSDTCCFPGRPEWDQTQTLGITQYLPVFSSVAWDSSPYTFRSAANMGAILQYDFLGNSYNSEQSKKSIQEAKIYQKFWYGDFYPLSEAKVGETDISAWQLHRSDLEAGLIYIFRQRQSPFISRELQLRAIEPDEQYSVTVKPDYSPQKAIKMSGKELKTLEIRLTQKGSATVVQYEKYR